MILHKRIALTYFQQNDVFLLIFWFIFIFTIWTSVYRLFLTHALMFYSFLLLVWNLPLVYHSIRVPDARVMWDNVTYSALSHSHFKKNSRLMCTSTNTIVWLQNADGWIWLNRSWANICPKAWYWSWRWKYGMLINSSSATATIVCPFTGLHRCLSQIDHLVIIEKEE